MTGTLLQRGLDGLAGVHTQFPQSWFHGHFGAALLAAHFLGLRADFPRETARLLMACAQRVQSGVHTLFNLHATEGKVVAITPILRALERTIGELSTDGHGAIYASLALKALHSAPELATAERVTGIVQLIQNARTDDPQRYYGYSDYKLGEVRIADVPVFASVADAMHYALHDHSVVFPDQSLNGHYYYLAGSKLHTITHAHALLELAALGYEDVAATGLPALRKQMQLCGATLLPAGLTPLRTDEWTDPRTAAFWDRERNDTHHIKLAYAVLSAADLLGIADSSSIIRALSVYWNSLP
jgi:hypothetical protein